MNGRFRNWFVLLALGGMIVWSYWPILSEMGQRWSDDPQYSHGYIVPLFAAFLLWFRRSEIDASTMSPSWWGIPLLLAGIGLWSAGSYFFVGWFAAVSLLLCLGGLVVVVGGWPALRWSWPSILFLGFMIPLPYRLQTALGGGLQRIASVMSTYALQTFGAPAIREGNIILINDVKIGVVEACSGLGMLVTFFALATAVALLLRSSDLWLRLVVVVSAVPVAVLANVIRITVTGLLYNASQDRLAQIVFHDVAGWLMMPLAIAMLMLEAHLLRRLFVSEPADGLGDLPSFGAARRAGPAR